MEPLVSAAEEVLAAAPGELQTVPPAPSAALAGLADIQSVSASLKDEVRAMSEALHQYRLYHLSSTESIALIDNTTLASAGTLLMGENAPTPHVLLDLATFVNEYVLSDRLVFLPAGPSLKRTHEGMEYLTNRFPALRPLNVSPALEECLVRVWVDSREWIESLRASAFSTVSQSFADELARGWRSLLPPHAEEAFAPESVLPNPLEASIEFGTAGVSGFFDHLWG
ncbi:MAG TPA: hypothetical protein VHG08_08410, partial [Longimicrobium sp.]|nr:hypothetical protein [Longimicrobium sp.]